MKVLLICPSERPNVKQFAEHLPLCAVPLMGHSLVEYWLSHLAVAGVKEVLILAHDRPSQILKVVGDGARWGIDVEVIPESRELSPEQALLKYSDELKTSTIENSIKVIDYFPGMTARPLFESYDRLFEGLRDWLPHALTPDRVGVKELESGVYACRQARIAPDANLQGPCWIGKNVTIGAGASVGPNVVIEDGCVIEPTSVLRESYVGPATFVGRFAEISHSFAWGNTLVDWHTGSAAKIPDPFLLCALRSEGSSSEGNWLARLAELYARRSEVVVLWKHLLMNKEG